MLTKGWFQFIHRFVNGFQTNLLNYMRRKIYAQNKMLCNIFYIQGDGTFFYIFFDHTQIAGVIKPIYAFSGQGPSTFLLHLMSLQLIARNSLLFRK